MQPLDPDFARVLEALVAQDVRFVLIGGLAMIVHGTAHITEDLDVVYARDTENLEAVVRAIRPLKPRLRGAPEGLPFLFDAKTLRMGSNFTLVTEAGDLDLLGDAGVGSFDDLWNRAEVFELEGQSVRVAAIEDLIRMKKHANRAKDQPHLMALEALLRIRNEGSDRE